jgi:hypothetical protein
MNADFFSAETLSRVARDDDRVGADMQSVVRSSKAVLASCPIEQLEERAHGASLEPVGHRCRHAYDTLGALVRRNDESRDGARKVTARLYAEGRVTLSEVAELLQLPTPDAIVFLEEHGYARPLDVIRLSDDERAKRYAAMRADRRSRNGKAPDEARPLVVRNVVASQRIEGVDARPWVRLDES